jgi:hypothetical protein
MTVSSFLSTKKENTTRAEIIKRKRYQCSVINKIPQLGIPKEFLDSALNSSDVKDVLEACIDIGNPALTRFLAIEPITLPLDAVVVGLFRTPLWEKYKAKLVASLDNTQVAMVFSLETHGYWVIHNLGHSSSELLKSGRIYYPGTEGVPLLIMPLASFLKEYL